MKRLIASSILGLGAIYLAGAQTLVNSTWESPTYTSGSTVNNKGGWTTDVSGTAANTSVKASTTQAFAGTQSALASAKAASGGSYAFAYHTYTYDSTTNANKIVDVSTEIWVGANTDAAAGEDNDLAGLDMFDSAGNEMTAAFIGTQTGSLYLGGNDGTGDFYFSFTGTNLPVANLNAWNKLDLVLDYSASTTVPDVSGYINGVGIDATASGLTLFSGTTNPSNPGYDFIGVLGGDTTAGATQTANAYFDNTTVTALAATPEPATFAVFGIGAIALLRRRRKA